MPEDLFRIQRNCLRLMGHQDIYDKNVVPGEEQKSKYCSGHCQTIKYVILLLLMISAQLPMMDYIIYHIEDLALVTASLSIVFTNVLTVIKTSTFLTYKRDFKQLMTEFEQMYDELHAVGAKQFLVKANVGAKRFVKLYFYSVSCTGLYFSINPLVSMIWAQLHSKPLVLELPMPMRCFTFVLLHIFICLILTHLGVVSYLERSFSEVLALTFREIWVNRSGAIEPEVLISYD